MLAMKNSILFIKKTIFHEDKFTLVEKLALWLKILPENERPWLV